MKGILILGDADHSTYAALMQLGALIERQPVAGPPLHVRYLLNGHEADVIDGKVTVPSDALLTMEFEYRMAESPIVAETYVERFEAYRPYGKKYRRSLRK